ncbi:glutathione S-transferase 3-like [Crotalus adamanteus]|uniref:glutathione transferase n=1 Tax=Crotalus adamanteus TaxID=8729 RepID=A0AAW1CAV7_CROAD
MESVRWLLAAAGVEFEEVFLETREQYLKLIKGGYLLFDQVPLVEMDGLKLVQTKAILNYIAGKYNLLGKDLKERAQYNIVIHHLRFDPKSPPKYYCIPTNLTNVHWL